MVPVWTLRPRTWSLCVRLYHIIYTTSTEEVKDRFVASIKEALKPDGRLVIVDNAVVQDGQLPLSRPSHREGISDWAALLLRFRSNRAIPVYSPALRFGIQEANLISSQIQAAVGADQHVVGVFAALVSAASWAVGTMLFKGIGAQFSASAMTLVKSLLSMVLLAIVLIFVGWTRIPVSSLISLILSGLIGIAVGDTCFFAALQRLQVHQLIVLMMLAPAMTLIMAILFLGEMPGRIAWLGIALVLTGVSLTLAADLRPGKVGTGTFTGIIFGFLAILCMGGSVIIAKVGLGEIPALQATFLRMSAGFVGMLAVALAKRQITASLGPLRRAGLQGRFLVAVTIVTFGGFWLSLLAVKRLEVSVANTLLATEPLFALPLSLLWLRERPVALAWSGAAIALPGALLLAFSA